jgi:hypothetical protein
MRWSLWKSAAESLLEIFQQTLYTGLYRWTAVYILYIYEHWVSSASCVKQAADVLTTMCVIMEGMCHGRSSFYVVLMDSANRSCCGYANSFQELNAVSSASCGIYIYRVMTLETFIELGKTNKACAFALRAENFDEIFCSAFWTSKSATDQKVDYIPGPSAEGHAQNGNSM